ncbi:MAG: hypothetical protein KY475_03405 [Planctomycetes bacterium]|nr:hypothetical protein [Planctomycetota bacterium]
MATRISCLAVLLTFCLSAGGLFAQDPPAQGGQTINAGGAQPDELSGLTEAVRRLEMQINALSNKYVTREEFNMLQTNVTDLTDGVDSLQGVVQDQGEQIRQIDEKYENSIAVLQDQASQINRILDAISRTDSQNQPILNIASAMQSQEFRRDFSQAINDGLRETQMGKLEVTNNMSTSQYLRINGELRLIPAFTKMDVQVPVGTLTTELAGEAPKNWVVAPPNYTQGIIIAPRQTSFLMTSF